jgi:hypothetical protein
MSELTLKTPEVSRNIGRLSVPALEVEADGDSPTVQNRIPLTVRPRYKVVRMGLPIDDGFRPFRVF